MPQALLTSSITDDDHPHHKQAPCFIAEVLSPATAATDVKEKWLSYQRLPSLRCYLLVDSERVWAQCHVRLPDGQWGTLALQADDRLDVQCGDASLSLCLDDLYEDTGLLPH
jgi:Uma2 family endonuclease